MHILKSHHAAAVHCHRSAFPAEHGTIVFHLVFSLVGPSTILDTSIANTVQLARSQACSSPGIVSPVCRRGWWPPVATSKR
jgi:hypothetical protein